MKNKFNKPFFSIITVTYNSELTISDTINSILTQTFQDYEFIIVDGKSTDKTLEIIKSYREKFLKINVNFLVISEIDKGIYDAMNKGISLSKGKVISILNSDDLFFDIYVLRTVFEEFNKDDSISLLYGNLVYFNNLQGKFKRTWFTKPNSFLNGWNPPHPSTFVKRSIYSKIGSFNANLYISADYDFLLRAIHINKFKSVHIEKLFVMMRQGGRSTKSLKNIFIGWKEVYGILKIHKVKLPILILMKRIFNKLLYKFKLKKLL